MASSRLAVSAISTSGDEQHQILEHIEVGALRPPDPAGQLRQVVRDCRRASAARPEGSAPDTAISI